MIVIALLVGALIGAAAGYLTAPRYRPPADAGEGQLRARAAQFYRASQLMDFWTMARLYTPAWQLADADSLREQALEKQRIYSTFEDKTRADMERTAGSITADTVEVEREGDWAVTRGKTILYEGDLEIPFPLEAVVWVLTGGDWWVYQYENPELQAYGSPPDFARELLIERGPSGLEPGVMQMPQEMPDPAAESEAAPEPPAETGDE